MMSMGQENKGKIDVNDLREACIQYHLPVEPELLEQLMDACDVNRDGCIDYLEFSNFLNWKDKMPSGFPQKTETNLELIKENTNIESTSRLASDADLVRRTPQSAESTPRRLQKQIDKAIGDHRTSSSMINAVIGGVNTQDYRRYGVPTVRSDLPAPRIKRVDDRKNYGDESDAYGLVNPSLFSRHNVYEKDFLLPRTKEEIMEIFTSIGTRMTRENLEQLYDTAAQLHPKGFVSVESFRNILDEIQADQVKSGQHPMVI
ncbi:hypothetical protein KUTeg_002358 [Tegillarca granosa]|uniref:EF-hand domain-containing protein n=1 Tax=Tegillarca granosa TaxID=220873 RepID=A0ABQ9FU01_TEGGR|nr:hypothetical protein KUTeg_002301 [Tegillarca granosa]KAJ8320771.1 hypothetical protein KUTeg_002358 [Tegillarca granosa]